VKTVSLFLILILSVSCTNSTPTVSLLNSALSHKKIQTAEYVDANVAGSKQVSTSDNYVGRFVIHSGTQTKTAETTDHYQLTIRRTSF